MPEVVNSVGNVVMRKFKHYITQTLHRWLVEEKPEEEEKEGTDWSIELIEYFDVTHNLMASLSWNFYYVSLLYVYIFSKGVQVNF